MVILMFSNLVQSVPDPGLDEVLIRVEAAGVNRPDIMQRKGLYPPPPGATDVPGLEVSGTVVKKGKNVAELRLVPRSVLWCPAEVMQSIVWHQPRSVYLFRKKFHCNMLQVFQKLFSLYGQMFLKEDNSNQVKLCWCTEEAAESAPLPFNSVKLLEPQFTLLQELRKNVNIVENLGADVAINYNENDFEAEIKTLTENRGVDVILDMVGGPYFPKNIKILAVQAACCKSP